MDDSMHDFNLASRKAEEAALRRFQATAWLESLVGPLHISSQPSEKDFISCLRNGLILCNTINKIQPGAVPKVVDKISPLQSLTWDSQPLPAYQYFENVRNFLVAAAELKLPAFEASDLERDNLEPGSVCKVVDCILALKLYHEGKQVNGENGFYKHARSPMILPSTGSAHSRAPVVAVLHDSCRRLDMSAACEKQLPDKDVIVRALTEHMSNSKENIDENLIASFRNGDLDPVKLFSRVLSSCWDDELQRKHPELKLLFKDPLKEESDSDAKPVHNPKGCRSCSKNTSCGHRSLFQMQKKELSDLKVLLSNTKREFEDLESQFENDLKQLGSRVQEMSAAALGYEKVVNENRTLYNMVQDLKGNIRVYCRVRPAFSTEATNVINYIGDDGSLVIMDPLKPKKDGRKVFQFNRVFGPSSTQDEVFKDTQPLIRSVMDGYNVCILAYGQTGSGKTHTMYGPSGGLTKDMGINYQALNDLFQMSNTRSDIIAYDINVQMVEIYNEQVRDLLAEDSSATKLEIRSCANVSGLSLPDATMHSVKSTSDVLSLMKLGEVNRMVSSTAINNRSSRSHSIVTVHVHGKDTSGSITRSCLHLVDLAGSERVDKSEVTGERLREAQYINKSLSCLGDVIASLAQKNSHIPYRNSKLTLLLQGSLGGHAKTLMFAHVSPEGDSFGETISTLKFAQRVSTVELGAARMNKESSEIMDLKEQISNLKKALANKEANDVSENTRTTIEQTPPRPRRLSIESGASVNLKTVTDQTPRSRRLSIENSSSIVKPKAITERTPRSRRLSIENDGSVKPIAMTARTPRSKKPSIENGSTIKADKVTTPAVPTRVRRLSLEGPKYNTKKDLAYLKSENVSKPIPFHMLSSLNQSQFQESEILSKSIHHPNNGESLTEGCDYKAAPQSPLSSAYKRKAMRTENGAKIHHSSNGESLTEGCDYKAAPQSPLSSAYKSRAMRTENGAKMQPAHLTKTPIPTISDVHVLTISTDAQKHAVMSSTNGKGSQIRKSLRSIGKLINGSEKKSQHNLIDISSPINVTNSIDDRKSPLTTANARTLRRRSLTGIPENSRRSSLGGNTIDSNINGSWNCRTPPPVHPCDTKSANRWV